MQAAQPSPASSSAAHSRSGRPSRLIWIAGAILLLLFSYLVAEAAYRFHCHRRLVDSYNPSIGYTTTTGPLYKVNRQLGYDYVPNSKLYMTFYDGADNPTGGNRVNVNNIGEISSRDADLSLDDSEFRIACLGDSFTAITPTEKPWPMQLADLLNADAALRQAVGMKTFKIINFGRDGTGIDQWVRVYDHAAAAVKPDLVIVNFMYDDVYRRFLYRDTVPVPSEIADYAIMCISTSLPVSLANPDSLYGSAIAIDSAVAADKGKLSRIRREIHDRKIAALPWLGLRPELLLSMLGRGSSFVPRDNPTTKFATQEEAVANSLVRLRELAGRIPRLLILFHPTVEECIARQPAACVVDLIGRSGELRIHNMLEALPLQGATDDEIKGWYNLPHDAHPSDLGCRLYAEAIQRKLHEQLIGSAAPAGQP